MFKKACPESFRRVLQQGRSHFDARSVLSVREHGKRARTPLAAFFNIPYIEEEYLDTRMRWALVWALLLFLSPNLLLAEISVDELPDITGGVIPLLSFEVSQGGELFSSGRMSSRGEIFYVVRLKNQTGDPILAESLIVVVERIQNMSNFRDVTSKLELPGVHGETETGKPYYRVPIGEKEFLAPFSESQPFSLEIQNPNLYRLYPPVLRVRGLRITAAQMHQDALSNLGMESLQ